MFSLFLRFHLLSLHVSAHRKRVFLLCWKVQEDFHQSVSPWHCSIATLTTLKPEILTGT